MAAPISRAVALYAVELAYEARRKAAGGAPQVEVVRLLDQVVDALNTELHGPTDRWCHPEPTVQQWADIAVDDAMGDESSYEEAMW